MTSEFEARIAALESEQKRILALFQKCHEQHDKDAEHALNNARKALEAICDQIVAKERVHIRLEPGRGRLNQLITRIHENNLLPMEIFQAFKTVQGFGNFGSHNTHGASQAVVANVAKSSLFALSAIVEWYFQKYATTIPVGVADIHNLSHDTETVIALSFCQCGFLSAESDWTSRQAAVAAYDPKTSKVIWRSERRSAMEAPKRDYDEITLQCQVKNIGKKSVERFKMVLQAPEASFATESYFDSSAEEQPPLFPGMDMQFPSQSVELRLPLEVPSLDLNWSVFLDDTLPCVGDFRVVKPG